MHSIETPPHRYLVIILFLSVPLHLPFFEILTPISSREEAYDKIFPVLVPLLWVATSSSLLFPYSIFIFCSNHLDEYVHKIILVVISLKLIRHTFSMLAAKFLVNKH